MRRSARNGEMKLTSTIRPGIDHQLRHLGDAADVLDAVLVGEAEVLVQAVAHVVAVEQVGVPAHRQQRFSTRLAIVDLPDRTGR